MAGTEARPRISVIIPTYNRCDELRLTLDELTRQRLPSSEFEVVVADDGSSDATKEVAESFAGRLRIVYYFQADLGFRAAAARNGGARAASAPILLFLDCGCLAGPDCLTAHVAAHDDGEHAAVYGHVHGYNPEYPMPGLAEIIDSHPPGEVYRRLRGHPNFLDMRLATLARYGGDLNRRPVPWQFFWSGNCSLRAEDFWAIGGFDEDFRGWGVEDLELAYRVHSHGLPFRAATDGWVLHAPRGSDASVNFPSFVKNLGIFLDKHQDPVVEMGTALIPLRFWEWADQYGDLEAWRERARGRGDVSAEVAAALRGADDTAVVVIGAGGRLPSSLPPSAVVADFDHELLNRALADSGHVGYHALGVRLPISDQAASTVVITSRLSGLWDEWGEDILTEARRVGRTVRGYHGTGSSWGNSTGLLAAAGLEEDISYYGKFTGPEEKAVLTVPMRIQAAWADNDPDAFADMFAEQGSLLMQDTQLTGREQIRDYMTAGFAGPLLGARVKGWPLTVDFLSADVAMAVTAGGIMMRGETEIAPERRIRATWVIVRQPGGGLRLLSHHGSPIC